MRYDICLIKSSQYRGMERCLLATDFRNKRVKRIKGLYEELLERHFYCLSTIEKSPTKQGLYFLLDFYRELKKYGIPCECIVYNETPLEECFGFPLEFLGIDIVCDMAESILSDIPKNTVQHMLNENGLCTSITQVGQIVEKLDSGDVVWLPAYIYKVVDKNEDVQ